MEHATLIERPPIRLLPLPRTANVVEQTLRLSSREAMSVVSYDDLVNRVHRVGDYVDRHDARFCVERVPDEFGDTHHRVRSGDPREVVVCGGDPYGWHRTSLPGASRVASGNDAGSGWEGHRSRPQEHDTLVGAGPQLFTLRMIPNRCSLSRPPSLSLLSIAGT